MDPSLTYDDILIEPQYSEVISRKDVDTSIEIKNLKLAMPVIAANMTNVISLDMCIALGKAGGIATIDQFMTIDDQVDMIKKVKSKKLPIAAACGVTKDFKERSKAIIEAGADMIVFDTPHAHSILAKEAVSYCRKKFPKSLIACGNVATSEGTKMLIDAGVDIIKVGVGPGAACITRVAAGVGVPQFTAVLECAKIAKIHNRFIIADGGVKTSGNFAKALAAGADLVMFGGLLAGCDEAPSELIIRDGVKYKRYFGSASAAAKQVRIKKDTHYKGKPNEFVEGAEGYVKYRGPVAKVVEEYKMGLASAMSYSNAKTIHSFQANVKFVRVTSIGERENGPHGLIR
ncbi:MAG: guanosine monophosphate reductase [Patescibacteria group bacterium]